MEKWHLAGIISLDDRPALTLPTNKLNNPPRHQERSQGKSKAITLLQSILRKMTEVIALF
ncbi:MAG: hypothetical protein KAS94_11035 [Desulfobulbaceae bacterium]|nr:hypothetical protein [Desulfobulbaceae bacterium]